MNFADLHCVLLKIDEFRRRALEIDSEHHNVETQLEGVQESNADTGVSSSVFATGIARLESSISFDLAEGSLSWGVQIQMTPELAEVRARLLATYYEDPYQTIVRDLAFYHLSNGEDMCRTLQEAVSLTLDDLAQALIQNDLLTIHREGRNAPFFSNL